MPVGLSRYWRFQGRALLTRLSVWQRFECWRLRRRFERGIPHEHDFGFFRHFDGGAQLFVDIGANLGQSALSFRLAHGSGRILSFEPNPDMEAGLRVTQNLLGKSFEFRMHGIGSRTEVKPLFVPIVKGVPFPQCATFQRECLTNNASARQLFRDWTGTDQFDIVERSIQLMRFDELHLNPAFVKIDVEGGEAEVVSGMTETIARCRPIFLTEGSAAQSLLERHGYVALVHEPVGNFLRVAMPRECGANVFFVPSEKLAPLQQIGALRPAHRQAA